MRFCFLSVSKTIFESVRVSPTWCNLYPDYQGAEQTGFANQHAAHSHARKALGGLHIDRRKPLEKMFYFSESNCRIALISM